MSLTDHRPFALGAVLLTGQISEPAPDPLRLFAGDGRPELNRVPDA